MQHSGKIKPPFVKGVGGILTPSVRHGGHLPLRRGAQPNQLKMTYSSSRKSILSYRSDLKNKARENRNNPSEPESKFWYKILQNKQLQGYKFLRQKPIENFIVDFYCFALRLAIEIDGDSHAEQERYDVKRTSALNQLGIKIVRYTNTEVMKSLDGVLENLEDQIIMREKELRIQNPSVVRHGGQLLPLQRGALTPPVIPLTKGDNFSQNFS